MIICSLRNREHFFEILLSASLLARRTGQERLCITSSPAPGANTVDEKTEARGPGVGATRQLLEEIVGPQHHWSFSLCWLFEELTRCSLFNCIAQPNKLIYSLICLHITR